MGADSPWNLAGPGQAQSPAAQRRPGATFTGIERDEAGDLAVTELMEAYFDYCPSRGWEPLPSPAAQAQLPTLMLELFRVSRRHDIKRGTNVRGFKGVRLKQEAN